MADAQLSAGLLETDTRRSATAGASNFTLTADNNALRAKAASASG